MALVYTGEVARCGTVGFAEVERWEWRVERGGACGFEIPTENHGGGRI